MVSSRFTEEENSQANLPGCPLRMSTSPRGDADTGGRKPTFVCLLFLAPRPPEEGGQVLLRDSRASDEGHRGVLEGQGGVGKDSFAAEDRSLLGGGGSDRREVPG